MRVQIEHGDDILVAYDADHPPMVGDRITIQPMSSLRPRWRVVGRSLWFTPTKFSTNPREYTPDAEYMISMHVIVAPEA
jgi:hypothetical protein